MTTEFNPTCPLPITQHTQVQLAHGSGGKLMHQLIDQIFAHLYEDTRHAPGHDSAVLNVSSDNLAYTTDSYVVNPLIFPGGDIGQLAVNGTVNDLAMAGARAHSLSLGLILEEGLDMPTLWTVCESIRRSADAARIQIVTGDTKVVDRGKGDGIFINTSGIGTIDHPLTIAPSSVRAGDAIIVNGDLARHGMAVMAMREGLEFESAITSDTCPLGDVVMELIDADIEVHCLRDLTRGGLSSALNEIASSTRLSMEIDEARIPVREDVASACELLGLDPLYVANEGRFVAFVPGDQAERALAIMQDHPGFGSANFIGRVTEQHPSLVILKSRIGANRILDLLAGDQLPRIC